MAVMCQGSPGAPAGATAEGDRPANDRLTTVFRLLSRPRRRRALYVLRERDGAVPVERLAARLVAREGGDDAGDGRAGPERERVEIALRHVHLPKLTAAGAVERDSEGAVRYAAGDAMDDWVARAAAAEGG